MAGSAKVVLLNVQAYPFLMNNSKIYASKNFTKSPLSTLSTAISSLKLKARHSREPYSSGLNLRRQTEAKKIRV